jgi:hypothetical protein
MQRDRLPNRARIAALRRPAYPLAEFEFGARADGPRGVPVIGVVNGIANVTGLSIVSSELSHPAARAPLLPTYDPAPPLA